MYVNGKAGTEANSAPPVVATPHQETSAGNRADFTPARMAEIRARLMEPFDPAEIKWRVTATATQQSKNGPVKRGQLVAYADQRAYTDRLNDVFGEWGWTRTYTVQVAQNFERVVAGRAANGQKQPVICAKVVVVSTVTVAGLGSHTGVGEEWADDENSATRAEAQAFKRACACFGLGRYLYDLDRTWEDLDQQNRPVREPRLPEWAVPKGAAPQPRPATMRPREGVVRGEALAQVQRLCKDVGTGLAESTLLKYGGVTEPARLGFAKLTIVLDKLTDISRGVARLRAAAGRIDAAEYASVCQGLKLASDGIDDIPNREALRSLLGRLPKSVPGS